MAASWLGGNLYRQPTMNLLIILLVLLLLMILISAVIVLSAVKLSGRARRFENEFGDELGRADEEAEHVPEESRL